MRIKVKEEGRKYHYTMIWVRPATRNKLKELAARQGITLIDFLEELAEKLLKVKNKTNQ